MLEYALDMRLCDCDCSSDIFDVDVSVTELRLDNLRAATSLAGAACSNDVESAGGVGGT